MASAQFERLVLRGIAAACAGVLLLGAYETYERWRFVSDANLAPGTVVAVRELKRGLPQPEISFQTTKGERVSFIRNFRGSMVEVPPVGAAVEVLYLDDAPGEAVENSFHALWGHVVVVFLVGLGGLGIASIGMFLNKRGGRHEF